MKDSRYTKAEEMKRQTQRKESSTEREEERNNIEMGGRERTHGWVFWS